MIAEIEQAMIDRIEASALKDYVPVVGGYRRFLSVLRGKTISGELPAIFVKYVGGGCEKVAQSYKHAATWRLLIITHDSLKEKTRTEVNKGAYAIIESLLSLFVTYDLGLAITPFKPTKISPIWDEPSDLRGLAVYSIDFTTTFNFDLIADDDAIADLLRIGLEGYLQYPEDDGEKDIEAIVELS